MDNTMILRCAVSFSRMRMRRSQQGRIVLEQVVKNEEHREYKG